MKKAIIIATLLVTGIANAKPVFTTTRPANDIGKVEALKLALNNNARPWECVEQELTHKATFRNASGSEKTYHAARPDGGSVSKGAALKSAFKGSIVFKCSEKFADQATGTLKNY